MSDRDCAIFVLSLVNTDGLANLLCHSSVPLNLTLSASTLFPLDMKAIHLVR